MATALSADLREPLVLARRELDALIGDISANLNSVLAFDSRRHVSLQALPSPSGSHLREYGLYEPLSGLSSSLFARDDRGTDKDAVRFISHPERNQHLLLALTLSWNNDANNAIRFISSQTIVFLAWGAGRADQTPVENRKQLLRLEWEGLNREGKHEARLAAHPHWQIDRWLAGHDPARALAAEAIRGSEAPKEFSPTATGARPRDIHWIRSVHLAAAARWSTMLWESDEDCTPHAASPLDAQQLKNWTFSSLRYLKQQFQSAFDRL